jgi:hypothetical protein
MQRKIIPEAVVNLHSASMLVDNIFLLNKISSMRNIFVIIYFIGTYKIVVEYFYYVLIKMLCGNHYYLTFIF